MRYLIFSVMLFLFFMFFAVQEYARAQSQTGEIRHKTESIVRYDILSVSKNLMSCAAYAGMTGQKDMQSFFTTEARMLFMRDPAQTAEETESWLAGALTHYNEYWRDIEAQDRFAAARKFESEYYICRNMAEARGFGLQIKTVE